MNSILIVVLVAIIFFLAYHTYGSWLKKVWGVDNGKSTPAHEKQDNVDYVPAKAPVLLGHHFSSIAGAGPIVGPIAASVFGWVPVLVWIIFGCIFFGGVQDFSSLFASIRHDGKSIGEIIKVNMGKTQKKLFSVFAWLTLLLVIASFVNIVANTFVSVPASGTSSGLFMVLAITFGFFVYRKGVSLVIGTVIGVIVLGFFVYIGNVIPLKLSKNTWIVLILGYIIVASVAPVWILLQPRDYLCSFLLYAMILCGFIGIVIYHPSIVLEPYRGFKVDNQYMFPYLFITIACGAISGFHSLIGSGTSSKQLDQEDDAQLIGYGGMLIEGIVAVVALITAAYLPVDQFNALLKNGGPVNVFSNGIAVFMQKLGVPFGIGKSFIALAVSAFALTSLDTGTRIGRFIFQEFFESDEEPKKKSLLTNMYFATFVTAGLGGLVAMTNWEKIWPIFGSANQLLAALALMAAAIWLKKTGKNHKMFLLPIFFMFTATIFALILLAISSFKTKNYLLVIFPVLLFVLALTLLFKGSADLCNENFKEKSDNTEVVQKELIN